MEEGKIGNHLNATFPTLNLKPELIEAA